MTHRILTISLTLAALALTALAPMAAQAQTPAKDLIPIKGTVTGQSDSFLIPMDPPLLASRATATGQMTLLGQQFPVTLIRHGFTTLGVDGTPLASIDGIEVLTYPDGSAAFIHTNGLFRPPSTPGFVTVEGTWTCTGGRGMFLGASGSGTWRAEQEIATRKFTTTIEGFAVMPNVKKQ